VGREADGDQPGAGGARGRGEEHGLPRRCCGVSGELPHNDGHVCADAGAGGGAVPGAPAAECDVGGGDSAEGGAGHADAYASDADRVGGRGFSSEEEGEEGGGAGGGAGAAADFQDTAAHADASEGGAGRAGGGVADEVCGEFAAGAAAFPGAVQAGGCGVQGGGDGVGGAEGLLRFDAGQRGEGPAFSADQRGDRVGVCAVCCGEGSQSRRAPWAASGGG